ncbi:MAG TPA: amino acid permease [Chloroflexota bacterium]
MADLAVSAQQAQQQRRLTLHRVLGAMHVWALGVGIVLVGEFMGSNFAVAKGGPLAALMACWIIGVLYVCLVYIASEMGSAIPLAGGMYEWTKHILGPLASWLVGLAVVFEYIMLEAADALVVGAIMQTISEDVVVWPWMLLTIGVLTFLNYRGVLATLTINFVITAVAFSTIVLLFLASVVPWSGTLLVDHAQRVAELDLPYGWIGVLAALQFGIWFYLGIEGAPMAAEETRAPGRAVPLGTMLGMVTLLVAATLTWFVATGLVPWVELGASAYPLFDAAKATGLPFLIVALFIGTMLSCIASANGCINDASRSYFSMARDHYVTPWFSAIHPKYRTPYRAVVFTAPIAVSFAVSGLLDQVITFSIASALIVYIFAALAMLKFRKIYPIGSIKREYVSPWHPVPAILLLGLTTATFVAIYFGYALNLFATFVFYIAAALYYVLHRKHYVDAGKLFRMKWPRPRGF